MNRSHHLGARVSALVDGALSGGERDQALTHLAGCEPCRLAAEVERCVKRRLGALAEPAAPPALVARLRGLVDDGPSATPDPRLTVRPRRPAGPSGPGPRTPPPSGRPRRRYRRVLPTVPVRRTVVGAGGLLLLAVLGATTATGADRPVAPIPPTPAAQPVVSGQNSGVDTRLRWAPVLWAPSRPPASTP